MKKKFAVVMLLLCLYLVFSSFTYAPMKDAAKNEKNEEEISENVEDIIAELDITELEEYLKTLSAEQQKVFGSTNIVERLHKIVSGEIKIDYSSFLGYIGEIIGVNLLRFAPIIVTILAIAIAYNIISSIKGKFASSSVENIVYFACIAVVIVILLAQIFALIKSTKDIVMNIQKQIDIFFPIILTLMTAIGAGSSVAVYRPAVAILSSGIAEIITAVILPAFIISVVFTIVGNLSEGVKLKKMSAFFSSGAKWLLGTTFFLFVAFLSVQGITASVYDGISVRTAKFALSKYVPVIGGYLSEGLNLVMAGSVLVKNAVGMTAIILIFISIIPIILQVIIFSLTLSLAGAIIEPLGDSRMSAMISALAKNLTTLIAIVLGIAFLYFIFLILVIITGNLVV